MSNQRDREERVKKVGLMLLRAGSMLQSSGSSTSRTRMTVDRIADKFGCNADLFITHRALNITVSIKNHEYLFSATKRTMPPGVNFKIVSGISKMSWRVIEENWSVDQIEEELSRLETLPRYPRLLLLTLVGLAGAGFCGLADGSIYAILVCFFATFIGLFVRQETEKRKYNPYLCVFFASLAATMFSGGLHRLFPGAGLETAFATCVLFLIPGVPLINSFTDMLDGNILNGILKASNGLIISFMIAIGLTVSLIIYQF